jgi:hypothetical protein
MDQLRLHPCPFTSRKSPHSLPLSLTAPPRRTQPTAARAARTARPRVGSARAPSGQPARGRQRWAARATRRPRPPAHAWAAARPAGPARSAQVPPGAFAGQQLEVRCAPAAPGAGFPAPPGAGPAAGAAPAWSAAAVRGRPFGAAAGGGSFFSGVGVDADPRGAGGGGGGGWGGDAFPGPLLWPPTCRIVGPGPAPGATGRPPADLEGAGWGGVGGSSPGRRPGRPPRSGPPSPLRPPMLRAPSLPPGPDQLARRFRRPARPPPARRVVTARVAGPVCAAGEGRALGGGVPSG